MDNSIYYIVLLVMIIILLIILFINARKTNEYAKTNLELHIAVSNAEKKLKADRELYKRFLRDMRTQMNNVVGFATLGIDETEDHAIYEYFSEIIDANNENVSLMECFNNIIITEGKGESLEVEYVSLDNIIINILKENDSALKVKNQKLIFDLSMVDNKYIIIDRKKLEFVLNNIIKVANKYANSNSMINIKVKEELSRNKNNYLIEIETIGRKINSNELKYVNKPTVLINKDNNINSNLSFNLIVAHYLIDSLGGKYHGSNWENGNRFVLKIPISIISKEKYENSIFYEDKSSSSFKSLTGKRALVVEDNEINAKIEINILKKFGMVVERVDNGKKALIAFHEHEPNYYNLILMDVRMPEMNGMRATNAIRKIDRVDSKDIPIIGLSASVGSDNEKECLEFGMNAYLTKPIDVSKLRITIDKYIK